MTPSHSKSDISQERPNLNIDSSEKEFANFVLTPLVNNKQIDLNNKDLTDLLLTPSQNSYCDTPLLNPLSATAVEELD